MSAKKSFSGTPYARPPSTPRNQVARQASTPGSILKTLFSPAQWFGRRNESREDDAAEENDEDSSSDISEEDEEESIGLEENGHPRDQVFKPNTPKSPSTPNYQQQQSSSRPSSTSNSPNAVLANFFSEKGDAPLTAIEIEGIKAILSKQVEESSVTQTQLRSAPSYATPPRRPYTPIFTPAKMVAPVSSATEGRKARGPFTPVATVSSPFRHRGASRSTFSQGYSASPARSSTPSKYELKATIPSGEEPSETGKRALEEIAAPAPKRSRTDNVETTEPTKSVQLATGHRTAASMLEILEADSQSGTNASATSKSPEQLKAMLNPYAAPSSTRKPVNSPRRTPARKQPRKAIDEIARNDAIEKRIPYQPKKASGLANSFSATDDDTSLFSPRRKIDSRDTPAQEQKKSNSAFRGRNDRQPTTDTPTKTNSSLTSAFGNTTSSSGMFSNSPSVISTMPSFSFTSSSKTFIMPEVSASDNSASPNAKGDEALEAQDNVDIGEDSGEQDTTPIPSSTTKLGLSSLPADQDSQDHSAHGGFAVAPEKTAIPSFGLGTNTTDTTEHKTHGGFTFGTTSSTTSAPATGTVDTNAVVHQLRDGTEYISPSKPQRRASTEKSSGTTSAGFVFTPSDTEASSSPSGFSFANYVEPVKDTSTSTGGFSFDPTKKVSIIGKTIGASSPEKNAASTLPIAKSDTALQVLALPETDLQKFPFSSSTPSKKPADDLQTKVLAANLLTFKFSLPAPSARTSSGIPATTNAPPARWNETNLKTQTSGWTCNVCMVPNKSESLKCVCCESEAPQSSTHSTTLLPDTSSSSTTTTTTAPSGGGSGGFNWAAAGLSKPSGQNWECSVCMISNPQTAEKCLACESEK